MPQSAQELAERIRMFVVDPLIGLLAAAALAVFVWGLAVFIMSSGDEEGRSKGKRVILWGIIGLFVIVSAAAILRLVLSTFGVDVPSGSRF